MEALNNLTKEQRYYLAAALLVGGYALYVRSRRQAQAPAPAQAFTPTNGDTGGTTERGPVGSDILAAINSAFGQQSTGLAGLIENATRGLSTQNAALAAGITTLGEGNVAALQQFQEAEAAQFTDLKTTQAAGFTGIGSRLTEFAAALTSNKTDIVSAIQAGFAAQSGSGETLLARLQEWFTGTGSKIDEGFAAQAQALQRSVTALASMESKVDKLPGENMYYLMLGTQTTASCAVPGRTADLTCYNSKHPFDGTQWLPNNDNSNVERAVEGKWGRYKLPDGTYDLVAIGRVVAQQKGASDGGGGNGGGGGQTP